MDDMIKELCDKYEIDNIDNDSIESIAWVYEIVECVYEVEPINAIGIKQKLIRRHMKRLIADDVIKKNQKLFSKKISNREFIEFAKVCYEKVNNDEELKEEDFKHQTAKLPEEVRNAIWQLLDEEVIESIEYDGMNVIIPLEEDYAYDKKLIIKNVDQVPQGRYSYLRLTNCKFVEEKNRYVMQVEICKDEETEIYDTFNISFQDAVVETNAYFHEYISDDLKPWSELGMLACNILFKDNCFNDKEKEILPLLMEISRFGIEPENAIVDNKEIVSENNFSNIKRYVVEVGCEELLPYFERLEKYLEYRKGYTINLDDSKNFKRHIKYMELYTELENRLNLIKYEPLWRKLYNIILISQKDYPKKVEKYCDKELLNNTRREIEEILRNNGYIGTYPNFEKNGELKGLKLVEAYNQYELVGREKNVKHYITCVEECIENDEVSGHLMITFLCGTQMMRKDAVAGDIHMCKFSANDKCFIEKCIYERDYDIVDGEEKQDLKSCVKLAIKLTELKRLSKDEREMIDIFSISSTKLFFKVAILGFVVAVIVSCLMNLVCNESSIELLNNLLWGIAMAVGVIILRIR